MAHDQSLQRVELAQAHQLGELQQDYAVDFGKQIVQFGVVWLIVAIFCAISCFIIYLSSGRDITTLIIVIICSLGGLAVYSALEGANLYFLKGVHMYIYTGGLLYWKRKQRRAVRWEQILGVYQIRGKVIVLLKNEPPFGVPSFLKWQSELYATIKREVDSQRSSDQE